MSADDNPDRSRQYQDATPEKLRDQLNENWRQLRLFREAVASRDRVQDELHRSIRDRDATIQNLHRALKLTNRIWPVVYAFWGGFAAGLAEYFVRWLAHAK